MGLELSFVLGEGGGGEAKRVKPLCGCLVDFLSQTSWSVFIIIIIISEPMRGAASDTGNISPTIVAKMVMDNIIVTPETGERGRRKKRNAQKVTDGQDMCS